MRRLLISLSLVLLALAAPVVTFSQADDTAADSSDLFLNAYMANEQGQQLEASGDLEKALSKYRYAASLLEQISHDDPRWQPLVVDYRKKRVMDNISRLQTQVGAQGLPEPPPPAESGGPAAEPELPGKSDDILPTPNLNAPQPTAGPSNEGSVPGAGGPGMGSEAQDQLGEMQSELRDAEQKLKAVEGEKEDLAGRLDDALKQLDRTKISETEMRGELQQAQDAYQRALTDHPEQAASGSQKELQAHITQLEDALKDAEADRDAADEQNAEYARRAAKAHEATGTVTQQLATANAQNQAIAAKYANSAKMATQLDAANKQIAVLTQEKNDAEARADDMDVQVSTASRTAAKYAAAEKEIAALKKAKDDAVAHADDLDTQLASTSKTAAKLVEAQKEIAALKAGDEATAQKQSAVAAQLADANKQIQTLTQDRDAARDQVTTVTGQLADAQKQITAVKADRDSIAAQRDQALADLAKARDAEKHVDQLMADNATLTQKLAADDKIIKDFKSNTPEKDKEIADLRKQVTDTKALLTAAQQQRDDVQQTLNQLQQQYDSTSSELAELKANDKISSTEKQTLTNENGVLRGIVLRQLKEQARREQAKRLVLNELTDLKVQSDTLLQRINYLGEPVVQLTDKEKALFKDPDVDLSDSDDSAMNIDLSAPKQAASPEATSTPNLAANETAVATPSATPAEPDASPALNSNVDPGGLLPAPSASPSPSGTPIEMANLATPKPAHVPGMDQTPASGSGSPAATTGTGSDEGSTGGGISSGVPTDLEDDARQAKDAFDRARYRDAERLYEKILSEAPNNVYSLSNIGVVYFRDQKYKLAEESLKKAIAVAPDDTFSHCTLGIVYFQEKRYDDAVNELVRTLAIDRNYAVAHNYLGITASQKGWREAAIKELETAIDINPKYADACFNLAVVYATGRPPNLDLARVYYKRAVDLGAEPDSALEQLLK